MQNNVTVSLYAYENLSEKHLSIFYRKSKAQKIHIARYRILKKFKVYTAEQAELFENMFDIAYNNSGTTLKIQYPALTANERIILAFLRIGISEDKICQNMGMTIEEQRRQSFNISKKLNIPVVNLRELVHTIFSGRAC